CLTEKEYSTAEKPDLTRIVLILAYTHVGLHENPFLKDFCQNSSLSLSNSQLFSSNNEKLLPKTRLSLAPNTFSVKH
ncbi:MAG: hypothetical protein L3J83_06635, partial [Proteobacteria bacterium]|nr:hypothetical protein [Pseudomonadota bacterium]